jgi:hypothetical protein
LTVDGTREVWESVHDVSAVMSAVTFHGSIATAVTADAYRGDS